MRKVWVLTLVLEYNDHLYIKENLQNYNQHSTSSAYVLLYVLPFTFDCQEVKCKFTVKKAEEEIRPMFFAFCIKKIFKLHMAHYLSKLWPRFFWNIKKIPF